MSHKHLFFAPHPTLRHIVNNIMISHTVTEDRRVSLSFPFPPLPEHSILFYPYDKPRVQNVLTSQFKDLFACTITGPQTQQTILSLGSNHLMIKIGFQPGALNRLLGQPMQTMIQVDYDGEAVFGAGVQLVVEAMATAGDFADMKNVADEFMFTQLAKIRKPSAVDFVIPDIIKYGGIIKIDALVKKANMSNRQFERSFKERMGVSPKFYSRLVRFGKAWLLKENKPDISWTKVAHECGYFDQMHLIRDFKEFANANPKEISESFKNQPFLLHKRIFH
jgi:AraC-like DNA-binding protein